jgi:hypothetical protein
LRAKILILRAYEMTAVLVPQGKNQISRLLPLIGAGVDFVEIVELCVPDLMVHPFGVLPVMLISFLEVLVDCHLHFVL